ncbi:alginate O-acetyltransferase AlgF (plasmid) [Deinococcus sp. KNUC1210]|uniref:alginate O-acetyltransferase AlgF n=1 Tax=Deinococcus sp. KNUC1210 TaxID=2917691 RepID=UPI001EF0DAC2|nr:alginate O-acetyltransferase AlgF [Deinococcus sp. KNUC1210]ULH17745.1 alginate O-acetyltransferase AlgF [Deinococcus sp. KNUC1210]
MNRSLPLLISLSLLTAAPVLAQDTLYQAAPPANAAFVRVVNAVEGAPLPVTLSGQPFDAALASREVSAYHVVPEGSPLLAVPPLKLSQPLKIEAGHFYTVALTGTRGKATLTVLGESTSPSVTQARVSFYNLGAGAASLLTSDGKVTLFKSLAPLSARSMNVNPVNVQLRVDQDTHTLTTLAVTRLQARQSYSVFVFGGASATATWVPSSTKP